MSLNEELVKELRESARALNSPHPKLTFVDLEKMWRGVLVWIVEIMEDNFTVTEISS